MHTAFSPAARQLPDKALASELAIHGGVGAAATLSEIMAVAAFLTVPHLIFLTNCHGWSFRVIFAIQYIVLSEMQG
jgi:hypothetical protein